MIKLNNSIDKLEGKKEAYEYLLAYVNKIFSVDKQNEAVNIIKNFIENELNLVENDFNIYKVHEAIHESFNEYKKKENLIIQKAKHPNIIQIK